MIRGEDLDAVKDYIYNSWIFTQEGLLIDVDPHLIRGINGST